MRRAIAWAILCVLSGCQPPEGPVAVANRPRAGGTDVTFFVAADSHIGAEGIEAVNRIEAAAMNSLPGTPCPPEIGGVVARPRGVLVAGDLTDHGTAAEWNAWEAIYGLTGREGLLKFPVFECSGNHDRILPFMDTVPDRVRRRHGGLAYSWDWGDLHLVCLDLYPSAENLRWLRRDLAAAGRRVPVVIYFHYSVLGPFSEWWGEPAKEAFAHEIEGYNVIGIFHGHYHGSYSYKWKGRDVFNIGSPRHVWHRFLAVRVTDTAMTVAAWDWDSSKWDWVVVRRINQDQGGLGGAAPAGS